MDLIFFLYDKMRAVHYYFSKSTFSAYLLLFCRSYSLFPLVETFWRLSHFIFLLCQRVPYKGHKSYITNFFFKILVKSIFLMNGLAKLLIVPILMILLSCCVSVMVFNIVTDLTIFVLLHSMWIASKWNKKCQSWCLSLCYCGVMNIFQKRKILKAF